MDFSQAYQSKRLGQHSRGSPPTHPSHTYSPAPLSLRQDFSLPATRALMKLGAVGHPADHLKAARSRAAARCLPPSHLITARALRTHSCGELWGDSVTSAVQQEQAARLRRTKSTASQPDDRYTQAPEQEQCQSPGSELSA